MRGALLRVPRLGIFTGCAAAAVHGLCLSDSRSLCDKVDLDEVSVKSLKASLALALQEARPPVARREPHTVFFGVNPHDMAENRGDNPMNPPIELIDDLYWIRDDTRKDEEVLGLLHAENEYTDIKTAHLAQFREKLYTELLSHIQEDDDEYPVPAGDGYAYWLRTVKGKSFKQYLRRKIGAAVDAVQVYLDVNAVPSLPFFAGNENWDSKQCDVQSIKPSPSGSMLAYCVDGSGYETYDVRLKDLDSGVELNESISNTAAHLAHPPIRRDHMYV